jgi:hypothetical protein
MVENMPSGYIPSVRKHVVAAIIFPLIAVWWKFFELRRSDTNELTIILSSHRALPWWHQIHLYLTRKCTLQD